MNMEDINQLRAEFEEIQRKQEEDNCGLEGCMSDDDQREDYPDYLKAMYAEVMPPLKSGIYFSRWDIKKMAAELDEHIVVDVRERMFQNYMRFIVSREDMENVIEEFNKHIDMKVELYKEYIEKYPAVAVVFDEKIDKAEKTKKYLQKVLNEYFSV